MIRYSLVVLVTHIYSTQTPYFLGINMCSASYSSLAYLDCTFAHHVDVIPDAFRRCDVTFPDGAVIVVFCFPSDHSCITIYNQRLYRQVLSSFRASHNKLIFAKKREIATLLPFEGKF